VSGVLEVRDLSVVRGPKRVIEGLSVTVGAGESVAIVGPNAAGKSTLLRALAGLLPAPPGSVVLKGTPLESWSREGLARVMALVRSEDEAGETFTVAERVTLGRYPHRGPFAAMTPADTEAVTGALARTGIAGLAGRRLATLSAGERQLAALARGLAQDPEVLLLDEPSAHLDVGHQLQLFRVLDETRARGVAVVAVVHDLQRAAAWAQRMVLIARGRLAADGPPSTVLATEACAEAFGVAIRAHAVAGLHHPLYSFEESGS
jgi:iron complex transport system ATP-binding protein